ncbi:extracellular solute-binding protein [Pelagovum pacificum]|uniref:Extracellular solute-binding protein n=1 Tax=Pelagovum pacificum TaxID=2588711 RepID=A0A5C5GDQ7_9RHOB|nr:extracellular solute-binding protein [Pelagovum pacificum]QQA41471.1 extracellular solute-binding protein [Pelagovum pacificum]TNY31726.1 extracellular solute-binding protein [Pelagovum pacificum]
MAKLRDGNGGKSAPPEGPYEIDSTQHLQRVRDEQVRFAEFVARFYDEAGTILSLSSGIRELRIILHLVTSHFDGKLVTSSSLAAESGLSYGTAIRTIDGMQQSGLILRREKTASGRSHSLHPSPELLLRWRQFAYTGAELVQDNLQKVPSRRRPGGLPAKVLPAPAVLSEKLSLDGGLRVLVHADPTFIAMLNLKRQFEMILGTPIHSRAHSIDRLRTELIRNAELDESDYDIVAVDLPWFGEMAQTERLLPLDDLLSMSAEDRCDIYPDALASSCWNGRQYGVPIMVSGEVLVHRSDLFERAGLATPRTTEDVLQAASILHQPGSGISGIAWNGGRGTPLGHTVLMLMAAFGQPIIQMHDGPEGPQFSPAPGVAHRPMFDSEAARQTVDYLLRLREFSPPDVLEMAWYDRARCYGDGRAAMAYSHSLLAPVYELDPASPAYRSTRYAPHAAGPAGAPIVPIGGYSLSIPSNIAPERIGTVSKALEALTSAPAAKLYLSNGSLSSPRRSVSRDPEVAALSPLIANIDEMDARGLLRMWPRPPIPGISDIISIAGEELHDMLTGTASAHAALAAAQSRSEQVLEAVGRTRSSGRRHAVGGRAPQR